MNKEEMSVLIGNGNEFEQSREYSALAQEIGESVEKVDTISTIKKRIDREYRKLRLGEVLAVAPKEHLFSISARGKSLTLEQERRFSTYGDKYWAYTAVETDEPVTEFFADTIALEHDADNCMFYYATLKTKEESLRVKLDSDTSISVVRKSL